MPITAKDAFDHAMARANHFLKLYEILHCGRERDVRSDWRRNFNALMRWPQDEQIVRVDGKNKQSLLILRESVGITRELIGHAYVSELLRAAVVSIISALDRYMHDLIVETCWSLLSGKEDDIPKKLKDFKIPVLSVKKALEHLKKDTSSRPGHIIKKEIQAVLHRDFTFQTISTIEDGVKMLGIKDFWRKIANELNSTPEDLQKKLRIIADRRNQIVHEADIILKTKAKEITIRKISFSDASDYVAWIKKFVDAIHKTCPPKMVPLVIRAL